MRHLCILLLSAGLLSPLFGQFTYDHLTVDYGSAVTFDNLRLIPIRAKDSFSQTPVQQARGSSPNYVALRDAMAQDLLRIVDRGGVNRLFIDNLSDQPVIMLSGEVLKGGKQDRVIAKDIVLPPNTRRNSVPVYCVEEKRWSISPKEWSYYHEGSMHLRRVVDQSQDQRQVWREVSYELKRDGVSSGTRAYTSHGKNAAYAALEREYLQAFTLRAFPNPDDIVGFVSITGSVVIGCDVFAFHDLLQSEYAGLIFSYIDEAITYGFPVDITQGAVRQYCDKLFSNERMQAAFIRQYGKSFTYEGRILHITTFNDRETLLEYESLRNY